MSHRTNIEAALERLGPLCDDCLAKAAKISPRQAVNMVCRRMVEEGAVSRASKGAARSRPGPRHPPAGSVPKAATLGPLRPACPQVRQPFVDRREDGPGLEPQITSDALLAAPRSGTRLPAPLGEIWRRSNPKKATEV